ncbi:MAG: permease [Fimbriimonadaceae bacterium]|nr:permease [Alphaproteobacteria bacterium]
MWIDPYKPMIIDAVAFFLFVVAEMAILFIAVSFLVGILQELLPTEKIKAVMSGRRGRGYIIGAGLGSITPFCSCSTIPLTVGLLQARGGFGPTMAFLFTSPLVNPMIVALLWMALDLQFTLIYATMAITLAVVVAILLQHFNFERFVKDDIYVPTGCAQSASATAISSQDIMVEGFGAASKRLFSDRLRLKKLFKGAVSEFRKFLPFILIGVSIGAVLHGFVPEDFLVRYASADNPLAVPFSAIIGIPLYLRASTMIPMVMPLAAKGVSLGAIAALMIGAAGASLPEVIMLKRIFRMPMMIAFLTSVLTIAVVTGFVFNAVNG